MEENKDGLRPARLSDPQETIRIIRKYNFGFQKKFGQNFLIDAHVLEKIIASSNITKDDCVLEIGPGIGTLTQYLSEAARKVISVEIDTNLMPVLQETLRDCPNVTVINEDILKTDIRRIAEQYNDGRPMRVCANLPYYITTPIIMHLLEEHLPVRSITVMVQKEVAQRMQAGPGTKDYGALSLAVQYFSIPQITANVPPNCFIPRPNVGSAVIHMEVRDEPPYPVKNEKLLFDLIRAAFNQRRKTLANAVGNASFVQAGREETANALLRMGLKDNVRGEALTLEQFAHLAEELDRKA